MEFNNQIYRAPSLPKMNRRNISSSVMSGAQIASTPKLRRSTFSFAGLGKAKVAPSLKLESTSVDAQLQETNQILVEIQKQLSLDFANRIVEKRQTIKASKMQLTRERAGAKERAIESARRFGSGIIKTFEAVAAPAKGIFQKILDFFSIIATGIIFSTALKWLENPANRAKLEKFFNFVVNHWKELLTLYGTYKLLRIVSALKRITDLFRRPPKWPDNGKGGGIDPKKPGPTDPCGGILQCGGSILKVIKNNAAAVAAALAIALGTYFVPLGRPGFAQPKNYADTLPPGVREDYLKGAKTQTPGVDALATVVAGLIGGLAASGALSSSVIGGLWTRLSSIGVRGPKPATPPPAPAAAKPPKPDIIDMIKRGYDKSLVPGRGVTSSIKKTSPIRVSKEAEGIFNIKRGMSLGGTVGGTGSGSVDSVSTMLAPGEEVIRASAAMLFRPLLKDINNNAGRMWNTFSGAIGNLVESNSVMKQALRILSEQLTIFKSQLDRFIKDFKNKDAKGGGIGSMPKPRSNMVSPELILHSDVKNAPDKKPRSTYIPINLPPQTLPATNVPTFSASGGTATEEPDISSVNAANPYMQLVPQILGIFV